MKIKSCSREDIEEATAAFGEDVVSGGGLGFAWPPRSYSCSFCTREFRSAQALGGHMNVHRRDRARLKQAAGAASTLISSKITPQEKSSPPLHTTIHHVETNLCMGLGGGEPDEEKLLVNSSSSSSKISKRHKTTCATANNISSFAYNFHKQSYNLFQQPEMLRIKTTTINNYPLEADNIDLELRLGDPPAVK